MAALDDDDATEADEEGGGCGREEEDGVIADDEDGCEADDDDGGGTTADDEATRLELDTNMLELKSSEVGGAVEEEEAAVEETGEVEAGVDFISDMDDASGVVVDSLDTSVSFTATSHVHVRRYRRRRFKCRSGR